MRYRQLDNDKDYSLGSGLFLEDAEALKQAIYTRLRLLYSEWWEAQGYGLPLFEEILGARATSQSLEYIELIISERILSTDGVISIINLETSLDATSRTYSFNAEISSIYGNIHLQM